LKPTALIRKHTAPVLKKLNQSRSIRVGANTELAMDESILPEQQHIAGGDTRMNPNLGVPAGLCVAGHPFSKQKDVSPSSLDSITDLSAKDLDRLMDAMYLVSLEGFKPDGLLRDYLQVCTAKLLMEHPRIMSDFGNDNKVVRKVLSVFSMPDSLLALKRPALNLSNGHSRSRLTTIHQQNSIPRRLLKLCCKFPRSINIMLTKCVSGCRGFKKKTEGCL
jgi:hypothetical protein